jgi:pimeloyl-ACP methyl ester carboxylesterase
MTDESTPRPAKKKLLKHLRASDARGVAQLATQATLGVTRIVEGAQQAVWSTLGMPGGKEPGTTRGITGMVFQTVQGITQLVGQGLDVALTHLQPVLEKLDKNKPESVERIAVLSALNGVLGDQLSASNNALALPMTLHFQGQAVQLPLQAPLPQVNGKILLLVHGLCMNDLQWHTTNTEGTTHNHGIALAQALGYTPIYLRYNTGKHTSQNGQALNALLQQVVTHWPVPVEEIAIVAHSMGGLVSRSAAHYGQGSQWLTRLKHMIFLGTPHHGAPLERAGNWVDVILESTPYTRPYAKLGQIRSAGITDLRFGNVVDEDWQEKPRFKRQADTRKLVPLPEQVPCYSVAATAASHRCSLADRLLGDGLVPLKSALGQHGNRLRSLAFAKQNRVITYSMNHMELLSSPDVAEQMVYWLSNGKHGHPIVP